MYNFNYITCTVHNGCAFPVSLCTDGYFYPDVVKYKKLCRKAKYKEYKVCTVIRCKICLIAEAWVSQIKTKTHVTVWEHLCIPNSKHGFFLTWFFDCMVWCQILARNMYNNRML